MSAHRPCSCCYQNRRHTSSKTPADQSRPTPPNCQRYSVHPKMIVTSQRGDQSGHGGGLRPQGHPSNPAVQQRSTGKPPLLHPKYSSLALSLTAPKTSLFLVPFKCHCSLSIPTRTLGQGLWPKSRPSAKPAGSTHL